MPSLRQHAGYLVIDHRDSPGLSEADLAKMPAKLRASTVLASAGRMTERDVLTCSHCERAVILEPLRVRDRGYCQKCNHYICDDCESMRVKTGLCVPMRQIFDQLQGFAEHGRPLGLLDQLPNPQLALAVQKSNAHYAHWERLIKDGRAKYDEADWDAADPYFRQMLDAGVTPGTVHAALSTITFYQGKRDEALEHARKAAELEPTQQGNHDNVVMFVDADTKTTPAEARAVRESWWAHVGAANYTKRQPHLNDRDPNRPIKVGYCSGDFAHHSACSVFGPFALAHTPAIEPYFYSSTETYAHDVVTEQFKMSPNWRHVWGESDDAVADRVRRDHIDILVDLSGYTANNRLAVFAQKAAPVQVTGWGYGTGLSWPISVMDYLIADATVIPPDHSDITEQIALFPCVLPYFPPDQYPAVASPLPSLTAPPTFGVFQRSLKINDECVQAWRMILERVPNARLIIKGDYCRSLVERMQAAFAPMLDRVAIINLSTSKSEHLAMWSRVDVALDTWPQSGGVASCEALWHGIPIVTYQGRRLMSRVASSLLTNLGLTEFIAQTPEQYVQCAVNAVANPTRLAEIRQGLHGSYASWNAKHDYLQCVEDFYRTAWQRWCQS